MTQLSSQEIDQIVRDVMRQMGALPKVPSTPLACASHQDSISVENAGKESFRTNRGGSIVAASVEVVPYSANSAKSRSTAEPRLTEYRLTSRLVTLESLPKLQGIKRLIVPVRAVVTPAVLDELRRSNVKLEFDNTVSGALASTSAAGTAFSMGSGNQAEYGVANSDGTTDTGVVLAVVRSRFAGVEGLQRAISNDGLKISKSFNGKCLIQATDEFSASLVGKTRLGVLITDHAAVAMSLVNRRRGLRAVQAVPRNTMIVNAAADAAIRDAAEVGANLLVVDPREFGFWVLRQIVVRFLKSGPYVCPEALQSRLD